MKTKTKNQHKPASERKIGLTALKYYAYGAIFAVLWVAFISTTLLHKTGQDIIKTFNNENSLNFLSSLDIEAVRVALLIGVGLVLVIFVLAGYKYSPFRFGFLPKNFYLFSIPFFGYYLWTFKDNAGFDYYSLLTPVFAIIPPFLFLTLPTLRLAVVEWVKEHPEYRRLFVLGRGGESSRWGGLREIFDRDICKYFNNSKQRIIKTKTSPLYIGKTTYDQDIRIMGRSIGLITDQHMITVAGSGAGKSRDAITNNLLTYCGGLLAFDPKGEHVRVTYERRKAYAPAYVLDPYGEVSDIVKTNYWNPLAEIDPEADSARGDLHRIASASIFIEKDEGANSAFFRENAQMILRGFLAHVVTAYPKEMRNLPTVYNIIKTGNPEGGNPSPKAMDTLLFEMMANHAIGDAPRDAASLLKQVSEREAGSYMSTIARGIDWINEPTIKEILNKPSDFSIRECKTKDASVYLVLPEKFMEQQSRFLRTFYTVALDTLDNHETPQPEGSERRVLFLFDEFNKLRTFQPAEDAALYKRSSYIKCWFIVQNIGQLYANYTNANNFLGNCDKQFFGIDKTDTEVLKLITESLGGYVDPNRDGKEGDSRYSEFKRDLLEQSAISELLNIKNNKQLLIAVGGKPLMLKRIPYYKNFPQSSYGEHDKTKIKKEIDWKKLQEKKLQEKKAREKKASEEISIFVGIFILLKDMIKEDRKAKKWQESQKKLEEEKIEAQKLEKQSYKVMREILLQAQEKQFEDAVTKGLAKFEEEEKKKRIKKKS